MTGARAATPNARPQLPLVAQLERLSLGVGKPRVAVGPATGHRWSGAAAGGRRIDQLDWDGWRRTIAAVQGKPPLPGAPARPAAASRPPLVVATARAALSSAPAARKRPPSAPAHPARAPSAAWIGGEYAAAADALVRCDFLLIAAGAGFSADSGLAVYKDIASVPAYRAARLSYADLCNPLWLAKDPELFFGFWGSCFNTYMQTPPHAGYALLARWRDAVIGQRARVDGARADVRPSSGAPARRAAPPSSASRRRQSCAAQGGGAPPTPAPPSAGAGSPKLGQGGRVFVFTSNVDTAFTRAGLGGGRALYEIHGNIRTWQCSAPCARSLAAEGDGTWQLPETHRFAVDLASMRAPTLAPAASPAVSATAERAIGEPAAPYGAGADAPRPAERADEQVRARNHPLCAHCGRLARPAILMFEDGSCVETDPDAYEAWEARVRASLRRDPSKRLVILEGGCGLRVPTVRRNSERLLKALAAYGTTLVRINLERAEGRPALAHNTVSIRARCLPALETLDRAIGVRLGLFG
ncbi:hypothetical protein KFE25_007691 [Diacronema lutheri]|uniref:Deacetylase sirtuin-type domain-containing protein n=2 Tax=Diacronema lutheri TaxID=2081491 RepID=A0A8J5XJT8_DIALT|nr:hypothetical protein KFE25_007691 [Diacronema lutheri]